jgi:hypothetical protein
MPTLTFNGKPWSGHEPTGELPDNFVILLPHEIVQEGDWVKYPSDGWRPVGNENVYGNTVAHVNGVVCRGDYVFATYRPPIKWWDGRLLP